MLVRRNYEPDYGRRIVRDIDARYRDHVPDFPFFIRRGWGTWVEITFNDGVGGRTSRSFFRHDYHGSPIIKEGVVSVDPLSFSVSNFNKLRIWQATKMGKVPFGIPMLNREEAVAAMLADAEHLRTLQPLNDQEFQERLLDWLQAHQPTLGSVKDGICTTPIRPDGTIDIELNQAIYCEQNPTRSGR